MKENVAMKEVMMYQASVKFEGKWYTSQEFASLDEVLDFVKRARLKSKSRMMPCNIFTTVHYVPAE